MKHYNIPIFIPHYGCPFSCVFCNQKEITGSFQNTALSEAEKIIEKHLLTLPDGEKNIAFFGGSFTAIDKEIMVKYLELGYRYVRSGKVSGIRISTRPDFIDKETLDILKKYGVCTIELGAQSFDDEVLKKSGRGHSSEAIRNASRLIKSYGCFELGLQLMTGLVGDTMEKSLYSANEAVKLKPECVRIYPTLVIRDTALCTMYNKGTYRPQTLSEAVETTGKMLEIFKENNISVIRVGLASINEMKERGALVAGPDHPSLRELCEGYAYRGLIENKISGRQFKTLIVNAPKSEFSKISGHKKSNSKYFYEKYNAKLVLKEADGFSVISE